VLPRPPSRIGKRLAQPRPPAEKSLGALVRAEPAALAAPGDHAALAARATAKAREAAAEEATVEVALELLSRVPGPLYVARAVLDGAVERLEVVADDLVEARALRAPALVRGDASRVMGQGRRSAHAGRALATVVPAARPAHGGVGLGGCYYAVNSSVTQGDLDVLAAMWQAAGCMTGVCDCAPTPAAATCAQRTCVPVEGS
jgi:hypothetical protein